jgi:hypothetical protein
MKQPYDFFLEYLTLYPQARETANISRCMQAAFRFYGYISPDNQWHEDKFLDGYTIQSLDRALREVKKDNNWSDQRSKELEKSYREMHSTVPRNEASISKGIKGQEEAKNVSEMKLEGNTGKVESRLSHAERMELIRSQVKDKLRV